MFCPKCRYNNPDGHNFCGNCGVNLQIQKQASPFIDYTLPHSYTPKFLADKILTTRTAMEGERKRVTVLFADVANFTAISEKIDPEEVHQIMDGCFKILMEAIHDHQGTINQFTGDGVMALFGAPVAIENHARNACLAALSIQDAVKYFSKEIYKKYKFDFKMRIGLNTGPVIVGSIGDDLRMDYTAIGDTTNLAARMENMAEPGTILVSESTYKRISQNFIFEPLGKVKVKGKEAPVEAYKLDGQTNRPGAGLERQIYSEMVGRDSDINKLEVQVMKAAGGEGSVINVIGEAGIGKSRLIAELKNRESVKRVTILEGRAISIGRNLSFYPIISLLKHWARVKDDDNPTTAINKIESAIKGVCQEETDEIFPFVATLMGMKLNGRHADRVKGIEGEALEKLIFKNLKDLLTKLSNQTPLVIIMEDLHWADTSSIDLLESLFRLTQTQKIIFINVFRPDHPETGNKIIKTVKNKLPVCYVEIHLQPLNEQMSEMLIGNMLNTKGLQHAVINQIILRSGGNPFFIEEVVRSFIDDGAVVRTNGEFKVTSKIDEMVIPPTINDVLMARIDRLEEKTRDLVKVASVIGRNFFYRILTEVATQIDEIENRLSYLKEIELIRERRRLEELEYLFKHALAQEAAYESILLQKRKNLHLEVARSIEKVFNDRLHEFYGMLALHYIKGEDDKKAEYYLVKAGEEALRSSASREALNYYQEGLKLYLKNSKDAADPEKLAMFEKNIALALFNKARMAEAVEHFDKVLQYWDVAAHPNRALVLIRSIKNIFIVITGMDRLLKNKKPSPGQRVIEILDLLYLRNCAYTYFDNINLFFQTLNAFNRAIKIDMTKSPEAINIMINMGGMFSFTGLSFAISRLFLERSKSEMDMKNIGNLMPYREMIEILNLYSGNWKKRISFDEGIANEALKKGDFFNSLAYIIFYFIAQSEMGDFADCQRTVKKLFEIAENYDSTIAFLYAYCLNADLLLKRNLLSEALVEADQGMMFSNLLSTEIFHLFFLGIRAEIYVHLNTTEKAKESLRQAQIIYDRNKQFLVPVHFAHYLIAQFAMDILSLKEAMVSEDESELPRLRKKALKSGKAAIWGLRKYAPYRTKTFRMMGEYYWLAGKQKKALHWWDKTITKGEELGARPDIARTYFEVGKALLDPTCKSKKWQGLSAQEYLSKAKNMYEKMNLQPDLDEMEKIMAVNQKKSF